MAVTGSTDAVQSAELSRSFPPAAVRKGCPARTSGGSADEAWSSAQSTHAVRRGWSHAVYVSTDDAEIAARAEAAGAKVIMRPAELCQ